MPGVLSVEMEAKCMENVCEELVKRIEDAPESKKNVLKAYVTPNGKKHSVEIKICKQLCTQIKDQKYIHYHNIGIATSCWFYKLMVVQLLLLLLAQAVAGACCP